MSNAQKSIFSLSFLCIQFLLFSLLLLCFLLSSGYKLCRFPSVPFLLYRCVFQHALTHFQLVSNQAILHTFIQKPFYDFFHEDLMICIHLLFLCQTIVQNILLSSKLLKILCNRNPQCH